jgi:hypothetical protein
VSQNAGTTAFAIVDLGLSVVGWEPDFPILGSYCSCQTAVSGLEFGDTTESAMDRSLSSAEAPQTRRDCARRDALEVVADEPDVTL